MRRHGRRREGGTKKAKERQLTGSKTDDVVVIPGPDLNEGRNVGKRDVL